MRIRFEPIAEKCAELVEQLLSAPEMPQDDEILFKVRLCVEEIVENIIGYAYDRGDGWLEAQTDRVGDSLVITLRDAGVPFNPLDSTDPDTTLSAEDRQIGGLGIFICKQMMDSISYTYENGCNVLSMSIKTKTNK